MKSIDRDGLKKLAIFMLLLVSIGFGAWIGSQVIVKTIVPECEYPVEGMIIQPRQKCTIRPIDCNMERCQGASEIVCED